MHKVTALRTRNTRHYSNDFETSGYDYLWRNAPEAVWCFKCGRYAHSHAFNYCGSALNYLYLPQAAFVGAPTHVTDGTISLIYKLLALEVDHVASQSSGAKRSFGRELQVSFDNHIATSNLLPRYDSRMPHSTRTSTVAVEFLKSLLIFVNREWVSDSHTCVGNPLNHCGCVTIFNNARTEQMFACFFNATLAKISLCNCHFEYAFIQHSEQATFCLTPPHYASNPLVTRCQAPRLDGVERR